MTCHRFDYCSHTFTSLFVVFDQNYQSCLYLNGNRMLFCWAGDSAFSRVASLTALFRPLDPALSENESSDLLKVCVSSVMSLPPETSTPEKTKEDEILDPKQRKVK